MLKIRLSRTGKKRQASYRVVVADKDAPRDGRVVERIGHYNPLADPSEYRIQEDRALHWLSVGAQPSDAVRRLLVKQGTIARLQRFHAGESIDDLVAEFSGTPVVAKEAEATAKAEVIEEIEEIVEEIEEIIDEIEEAEAVEEIIEEIEEIEEAEEIEEIEEEIEEIEEAEEIEEIEEIVEEIEEAEEIEEIVEEIEEAEDESEKNASE